MERFSGCSEGMIWRFVRPICGEGLELRDSGFLELFVRVVDIRNTLEDKVDVPVRVIDAAAAIVRLGLRASPVERPALGG